MSACPSSTSPSDSVSSDALVISVAAPAGSVTAPEEVAVATDSCAPARAESDRSAGTLSTGVHSVAVEGDGSFGTAQVPHRRSSLSTKLIANFALSLTRLQRSSIEPHSCSSSETPSSNPTTTPRAAALNEGANEAGVNEGDRSLLIGERTRLSLLSPRSSLLIRRLKAATLVAAVGVGRRTQEEGSDARSSPLRTGASDRKSVTLWRGMKNTMATERFLRIGGTELAPMSATTDLDIAIKYAKGAGTALLFKLNALTFMHLGAELAFLSAFPQESEYLYPPLTLLQPTGTRYTVQYYGAQYVVVEVVPEFPT